MHFNIAFDTVGAEYGTGTEGIKGCGRIVKRRHKWRRRRLSQREAVAMPILQSGR